MPFRYGEYGVDSVEVIRANADFLAEEGEYWILWSKVCKLVGKNLAENPEVDLNDVKGYNEACDRMTYLRGKWGF